MELFYRKYGKGKPIVILHGLYGSSDNWVSISKKLSEEHEVWIPDFRNHGASQKSSEFNYQVLVEDLLEFLTTHSIVKPILIGHSMGGKVAFRFSVEHPELIDRLIIADISPRSYQNHKNYQVLYHHHVDILESLLTIDLKSIKHRIEAEDIVNDRFHEPKLTGFLLKNLKKDKEGTFSWKINIKVIRDNLDNILKGYPDDELRELLSQIKIPVIFLKGEFSSYLSKNDLNFIKTANPKIRSTIIKNAGHWLHAEQPQLFTDNVLRFIKDEW